MLAGSFGGINLEDISAPRCFEIERRLKERCDIPIFHDDQHGTAVVTLAGLINALKIVGKDIHEISVVTSGAGAADASSARWRCTPSPASRCPACRRSPGGSRRPIGPACWGLCFRQREMLYGRIDQRVDEMLRAGLLEEAKPCGAREWRLSSCSWR